MTAAAPTRSSATRRCARRISSFADRHRSLSVIIGMSLFAALLPLVVLLPPFSNFSGQAVWIDTFTNAGVFVLLALGLNIVVGLAGLLDLGYAAFFAIGAYTFAFAASPTYDNHVPFWVMLLIGAAGRGGLRHPPRRPDPAPARRLPGDRDPGLRRDRADRVQQRQQVHAGTRRHRRHRLARASADYVFPIIGNPWPYYLDDGVPHHRSR